MNLYKIALSLLFVVILFSFSSDNKGIDASYGVTTVEDSRVLLDLNEDMSFEYKDLSDPKNPIQLRGSYTLDGNKVVLTSNSSAQKFHKHWKLSEKGNIAKARRGLSFYRLARME